MRVAQFLLIAFVLSSCFCVAQSSLEYRHNLMPVPAHLAFHSGKMLIDRSFAVSTDSQPGTVLKDGVQRMVHRLEGRTGYTIATDLGSGTTARLLIHCKRPSPAIPQFGEDESYTLEITPTQAVLSANESVGVLRGLETFLQLVDSDSKGYYVPAVSIQDAPRFPWRGLLVDVGRHFEPVEEIKRTLDGMAAVKMNVLHWHLTEDQGFRIESKKFPKLAQMGSDGQFYTQEQVKDVIAYAAERGIRVMPEFDMPAHSTSWFVAYPQYASAPGPYQIEREWGVFDPTFNPADEHVYKFLDAFLREMAKLFPDEYIHIGGDESTGRQWDANPAIQAFKKKHDLKDNAALQAYFNKRIEKILKKHGKKMVGWDEIFHPDLPKDVVVESWRGQESLNTGAKQGYRGILAKPYYLDLIKPASEHYLGDPLPPDSDLTPEQAKLVLGGEACMWSEQVTPETIDSRIWPRLAAVAERLWSPGSVRDVPDMYRRLARMSIELEELGLQHEENTARMLRRMVQDRDIGPMMVFASTLQPGTTGQRHHAQKVNQLFPYVRMADAVVPDPPAGRELQAAVDTFLVDPAHNGEQLAAILNRWKAAVPEVKATVDTHPVLAEVAPRVQEFDWLANAGLEAVNYIQTQTTPPQGWLTTSLAALDEAAKPQGAVRFVVLEPLRQLVQAAGGVPTTPAVGGGPKASPPDL
ncbi:MAG: family 20 glycosylhydrolase [Terriglobia bacterium]|nr:family 20 glycosylhydrolase [Terriglobia bacterium]